MFKHLDITVHNRQLHVVTTGKQSAPAILLLHGYPQSWLAFEDLMKLLSKDYYVLAVDLPGIGDSEDIGYYDKKKTGHPPGRPDHVDGTVPHGGGRS